MKAFLLMALLVVAASARSLKQTCPPCGACDWCETPEEGCKPRPEGCPGQDASEAGTDNPVSDTTDQTQETEVQPVVTQEPQEETQPTEAVVTETQPAEAQQAATEAQQAAIEAQQAQAAIEAQQAQAAIEAQQAATEAQQAATEAQQTETEAQQTVSQETTNAPEDNNAGTSGTINCGDCQVYVEGDCQLAPVGTACAEGQGQCLAGGACLIGGVSSESVPSPPEEESPSPSEETPSPPTEEAAPSPPAETPSPPAEATPAPVPSPVLASSPAVVASPPVAPPAVPDNVLCSNTNLLGGFSPVLPSQLPEDAADLVFKKFLDQDYTNNGKKYKGCGNYTTEVAVACQQVVSQALNYKVLAAATCIDLSGSWNNGVEAVWIEGTLTDSPATGVTKATSAVLRAAVLKPDAEWNYEENTTCPGPITGAPGSWEPLDVRSDGELDPVQVAVFESTYAAAAQINCTSVSLSDREACSQLVAGRNVYQAFTVTCVEGNVTSTTDRARIEARAFVGLDGTITLNPLNITLLEPSAEWPAA